MKKGHSITQRRPISTKYANLAYDIAIKRVFGNKFILIAFLNTFLIREGEAEIIDLVYREKEIEVPDKEGRRVIFDVYCTTSDGRHIIIEMQRTKQENFLERALYYIFFQIQCAFTL